MARNNTTFRMDIEHHLDQQPPTIPPPKCPPFDSFTGYPYLSSRRRRKTLSAHRCCPEPTRSPYVKHSYPQNSGTGPLAENAECTTDHGSRSLSRCCQPVGKEQPGNVDTLCCCLFGGGGDCGGFIEVEYTRRTRLEQGASHQTYISHPALL